jgi:hydrogenase nickel incorporation protein HypA/HybF
MHEMSLLRGLLGQIETTARRHGAVRVSVVRLKLGPLAHIEPDHLREHFVQAARGTVADSARLEIEMTQELHDLTLESMDVDLSETEASENPVRVQQ